MNSTNNVSNFIEKVKMHLKEYGFKLSLENTEFILTNNISVSGYFSENESILKVAINKPLNQWLPILVHEYGHFLQYIEQASVYRQLKEDNYLEKFDLWLNYQLELGYTEKLTMFNYIFQLERDCELRAVNLLEQYSLPIESQDYIQKANSYLMYYSTVFKNRAWNYNELPYNNYQIYTKMPNKKIIEDLVYEVN